MEAKIQICLPGKLSLRVFPIFCRKFWKVENMAEIGRASTHRILFDPSECRRRGRRPGGISFLSLKVQQASDIVWKLIEILIKSFWILEMVECIMYCRIFLLFICRPPKGEVYILGKAFFQPVLYLFYPFWYSVLCFIYWNKYSGSCLYFEILGSVWQFVTRPFIQGCQICPLDALRTSLVLYSLHKIRHDFTWFVLLKP